MNGIQEYLCYKEMKKGMSLEKPGNIFTNWRRVKWVEPEERYMQLHFKDKFQGFKNFETMTKHEFKGLMNYTIHLPTKRWHTQDTEWEIHFLDMGNVEMWFAWPYVFATRVFFLLLLNWGIDEREKINASKVKNKVKFLKDYFEGCMED